MNNLLSLAALHSGGFTHKDLKKIFETNQNYSEVLDDLLWDWKTLTPWMTSERRNTILEKMRKIDIVKIKKIIDEKSIHIITVESELYPEKLKTINQTPYLLYVRGNLREERKMLGIVWSRKNTNYGKKILEKIIPELVNASCGIVSWGAYGIDALSHMITLDNNWYTISVFGSGIDKYYPVENTKLFEDIISKWLALVSIFPIGTQPEPFYFPIRNEIVAALSDWIIIPEAWIKSGTLITANLALEHGRDVFAIPGDVFRETSMGSNRLIARGEAKCTQSATDILEEYFPNITSTTLSMFAEKVWEDNNQKMIYNIIMEWHNTPDSIWQNSDYTIDIITTTLTLLEINWHIRLWSWWRYETI